MRITDMITKMNLLDIYQLLPTTSVGNEKGKQMRIQILILGFKGLRRIGRIMTGTWRDRYLFIFVVPVVHCRH